jgi:uridine kinase
MLKLDLQYRLINMSPIPPEFIHSLQDVVGYFTAKSLVQGFERKLGGEGAKAFIDLIKRVGAIVIIKTPELLADTEGMLATVQESSKELQDAVDKALQDPLLKANIQSLLWDGSIVVGISGGSCSGKTWLSKQLESHCNESICLFALDGYYKKVDEVNRLPYTHDNPESINISLAAFHLGQLKAGKEIEIPKYNFQSQMQDGSYHCKPSSIIVVEGIFAFSDPLLLGMFDLRIWVEANDIRRYERRLERDLSEREIPNIEEIKDRYHQHVTPGYRKFIEPYRKEADFIIQNNNQCGTTPRGLDALLRGIEQLSHQR